MTALLDVLLAAGPWGVLAAGLVAVVLWAARIDHRLDGLDHEHKGRVPKVERAVDQLEADFAAMNTQLAKLDTRTENIEKGVDRVVSLLDRERTR